MLFKLSLYANIVVYNKKKELVALPLKLFWAIRSVIINNIYIQILTFFLRVNFCLLKFLF